MRTFQSLYLVLSGLFFSVFIIGCQSQPTSTPEPTPTANVVIEVVTSTTVATFAPTETQEATITPLATFTPIGLDSPTPTARATSTRLPTKVPAASTPKVEKSATPAPTDTATPAVQYPAPQGLLPATGDSSNGRADIQFQYGAVGPLRGSDCYLLNVQMVNPNATSGGVAGDSFLDTLHCGDQSQPGKPLIFWLYRPTFHNAYTFGTLERNAQNAAPTDHLNLLWYVQVVQNNGLGPDGVHYNTTPLSPNSATLESVFFP